MKTHLLSVICALCISTSCFSQADSVKYTHDFVLKDGLYRTFEDFKNNRPFVTRHLLLEDGFVHYPPERISYRDSTGKEKEMNETDIWGMTRKGLPYINFGHFMGMEARDGHFVRFHIIGAIMLFTQSDDAPAQYSLFSGNSAKQFFLDFRTGEVSTYTIAHFMDLIEPRDKELYNEFIALADSRERKIKMFSFLLRYNERHPIYFKAGR